MDEAVAVAKADETPISRTMNDVRNSIDFLEQQLIQLVKNLEPIMRPEEETRNDPAPEKPYGPKSQINGIIDGWNREIQTHAHKIAFLIDRIEL